MNEEKSSTNIFEKYSNLHIRRVPLAYEHPKEKGGDSTNGQFSFVPLWDGCEYYRVSDDHNAEREQLVNRTGKQWESLEKAFFGLPHEKFRDHIVSDGKDFHPSSPDELNEIVLRNHDAYGKELLNPNSYTPIPLTSPDGDGFGFALYKGESGVPVSPIFTSEMKLRDYCSKMDSNNLQ